MPAPPPRPLRDCCAVAVGGRSAAGMRIGRGRSPALFHGKKVAVHPPSIELFQLAPNDQLKPSDPTTPGEFPLRLLPSGPDLVRGTPPRGTRLSTHHGGDSPTTAYLKREFDPGRASSGLQGIANSPSSTADRKCSESMGCCQFFRPARTPRSSRVQWPGRCCGAISAAPQSRTRAETPGRALRVLEVGDARR